MNVCKKLCNECPFSNQSLKGWLASYSIQDFIQIQANEVLFPCHLLVPENGLDLDEVQNQIANGNMKLCRGYVESIIKSCKRPQFNPLLIEAVNFVRSEGTNPESMAIWDFKKHHEILK